MRRCWITDAVYHQSFELLLGGREAQLIQYLRRRLHEPTYRDEQGCTGSAARTVEYLPNDPLIPPWTGVWFRTVQPGNLDTVQAVAHESVHLMRIAMRRVGVVDEEAQAYYLGWCVRSILAHMTAVPRRRRKTSP